MADQAPDASATQAELTQLFNPAKLTSPAALNDDIRLFCQGISDSEPFFIPVEPELWSKRSCCDLNVKEYIRLNAGQMVCGYIIWSHPPQYMEAERHAIWFKEGVYKDISLNIDGENQILFIPDTLARQGALKLNKRRMRWGKDLKTRQLIALQEINEERDFVTRMRDQQV